MITSAVFIALIGTLQFKATISAAIGYEPIKITVNENFNAEPGQLSTEFQSLEPGVVHQGTNFYFKPKFNLPSIPHHIEAFMSLIQQHHSCAKDATKVVFEKDKLMEILMPFFYPKEALSDTIMEEENNSEIVEPVPILITEESKPVIPELEVIPEARLLSPLSFSDIPPIVQKEVKNEESVTLEETGVLNEPTIIEVEPKPTTIELEVIPEGPVLTPFSSDDIRIVDEVKIEEPPMRKHTLVDIEAKPVTTELLVMPEAPVLPALSFNGMPSIVDQEVKKEESLILEDLIDIFPTKPAITVAPITEPIITYVEPKPSTSGLLVIPEAPVLPSLSFHGMPSFVEKEVKKEESIILEESTGESQEPTIIEVEPKPATPELVIIPEAPILPTLSANDIHIVEKVNIEEPITLPKPIFVDFEPKPKTSELIVIPEAPVLPLLSLNDIPPFVEEELKKQESIILEQTGVFPKIPEITVGPITKPIINYIEPKSKTLELLVIPEAPVLPPLPFNDIHTFVEEMEKKESILLEESTGISQGPTIIEIEPEPATTELEVIPEAPVLPPLSHSGIPASVEKEVKKEESIILEESTGESQKPTLNEVELKPATPELVVIPEAPVLPAFSVNDIHIAEEVKIEEPVSLPMFESIAVDIEPKPVTLELQVIPEAPILPPLSFNGIPAFVEEEVKKEESVLLEKSTGVLQEPTIIEVKPKPATPESVLIIPGKLHSLSFEDIHTFVEEEMKNKESIKLEGSTGESQGPIIIKIEPKPATPELEVIPETPVLPPLSFKAIPDFVGEELKKEESVLLEEPKGIFPEPTIIGVEPKSATSQLLVIPEAPALPPLSLNDISQIVEKELKKEQSIILEETQEPTMIEIKPKHATPELIIMPEAPVLPILSENDIRIVEEVKIEKPTTLPMPKSIVVDIEPKPVTPESFVIPEPPMLPPLSFNGFPSVVKAEVKKEESLILEESTGVLQEPAIIEVEPKPATSKLLVIPEAPVLPPMPEMPVVEEIKSDESILLEESKGSIPEISARPTLESFVETESAESFALENNIFPVGTEEVKIEIPILLEESIEVFPPVGGISSGPTLQEPEITNSYVSEEVFQTNPEPVVGFKETLPPTIIQKPSNNLGIFSYAPFLSHLSNPAPKSKKVKFPKLASLERFLLKKHPFSLPVTPFPKLSLNAIKSPILGNKNQFLYPTSYAHDVVEKRIAPNMAFKKKSPPKRVKIYVRSNVPKGPSYL